MTTPKTGAERQAELKARRKAAGLQPLTLWVHAADAAQVKAYAANLQRRRERAVTPSART